ncbi:hypothetical protein ACJX0J_028599, partial [Zea mays]
DNYKSSTQYRPQFSFPFGSSQQVVFLFALFNCFISASSVAIRLTLLFSSLRPQCFSISPCKNEKEIRVKHKLQDTYYFWRAQHYAKELKYPQGSLVYEGDKENDFLYYLPDS